MFESPMEIALVAIALIGSAGILISISAWRYVARREREESAVSA